MRGLRVRVLSCMSPSSIISHQSSSSKQGPGQGEGEGEGVQPRQGHTRAWSLLPEQRPEYLDTVVCEHGASHFDIHMYYARGQSRTFARFDVQR